MLVGGNVTTLWDFTIPIYHTGPQAMFDNARPSNYKDYTVNPFNKIISVKEFEKVLEYMHTEN